MHLKPLYCFHICNRGLFFGKLDLYHKKKQAAFLSLFTSKMHKCTRICAKSLSMQHRMMLYTLLLMWGCFVSDLHLLVCPLENYYACYKLSGKSCTAEGHGVINVMWDFMLVWILLQDQCVVSVWMWVRSSACKVEVTGLGSKMQYNAVSCSLFFWALQ